MCAGQASDEIGQELLRGLVDPLQAVDGEDERLVLALPHQYGSQGLKDLLPPLLGLQLEVLLVLQLKGEDVVQRRQESPQLLVEMRYTLFQLALDQELLLTLRETEVCSQDLQERQIGNGAAVLEAFALQVGVLLPGERPDELKEEP